MRIAVNTRFLLPRKLEGFGWYSYETLRRITTQHPEHQFIFLFDRPYDKKFIFSENITPVVIGPPARHPFLFWWWFEKSVTRALKKHKADLFLSPDGYLSLSTNIPSVAVIHDLNFEHNPEDLSRLQRWYYRKYFPLFAKKAVRIATVSGYSKKDIVQQYGIPSEKIDITYNGVNTLLHPISRSEKENTRKRFTGGNEYFIYVGALHPRKNLARMFTAYDQFIEKTGSKTQLLIVGEKTFWSSAIEKAYSGMKHRNAVLFTGHLQLEDLNDVIAAARAMVYISYFEGFGLPLVEAMRCEIPVIAANTTSLPEVAGDAALYCDPFSLEEIESAMTRMDTDENLRKELIEKGIIQVQKFDWQKTADDLFDCLMKAANA
jgi:glycosyltransferase involved in cell wall biosynthesis